MQGPVGTRYATSYHGFPENQSHVNGAAEFAENRLRDPVSLYDLINKAEQALLNKTFETDQLRAALESSQREVGLLRRKASSSQTLEDSVAAHDRHFSNGIAPHDRHNANGNVLDRKEDALHLSPPLSPSRQNMEEKPHESQDNMKQDMMLTSTRPLEEQYRQLRSCLVDATLKETQLVAEISLLERKLAELQVLLHREQQNVADATAKALSIREELVDKNMKLAYENQALGQERNIFVSSLLPLLEEFDFHPTADAQSIVSSVKALVQYLKDRVTNERKSKEVGFYRPWPMYAPASPGNMQSPPRFVSAPSPSANGRGLELVPQGIYPQTQRPASPSSPMNVNAVRSSTPDFLHHEVPDMVSKHNNPEALGHENGFHPALEDAESRNNYNQGLEYKRPPHLPPLPEEPNHAPSEEEDPLPAVAGLRIVGDAVLGSKLTVCGHSINGTLLCNFQWIRYYPDGAPQPDDIEGASQTEYILSADDCDTFIAIQCCPMDERGRKGEQVTEFANNQNLIKCDQTLEDQINSHIVAGHAHFEVMVMIEGTDENWEPGVLLLKRSSYEIKKNNLRLVKENYSSEVNVRVVLGQYIQCAIRNSDGKEHMLSFKENRVRDRAVLTLRRFRQLALDGKKGKGKSWFSKKAT